MRIITNDEQLVVGRKYMLVRDMWYMDLENFFSGECENWDALQKAVKVERREGKYDYGVVFPAGTVLKYVYNDNSAGGGYDFVVGDTAVIIGFSWLADEGFGDFVIELD